MSLELKLTDNISTTVLTTHLLSDIDDLLRVRQPGFMFSPAYKRRQWDGYIRFLKGDKFPCGLTEFVMNHIRNHGHAVTIHDERKYPVAWSGDHLHDIELYPHQREAIDAVVSNVLLTRTPWPRGIIQIGTSGGKTAILAALAQGYNFAQTLVLLHRKELLYQIADDIEDLIQEPVGKIGDGQTFIQRVTVGMVQTLAANIDKYKDWLADIDVLLIDECHRLGAETHRIVTSRTPAYVRVGVSATPFKDDPVHTFHVQGVTSSKILYSMPASALADIGVVTPVRVRYYTIWEPITVIAQLPKNHGHGTGLYASKDLNWPQAYRHLIVENARRNGIIETLACEDAGPTLIIVQRIEHGQQLSQFLQYPFMTGSEDTATRQAALQALGNGKIRCLIATTIFDEGVNVPSISRLILAAGGKSPLQLIQRIGRGMRRAEGKQELLVIDFLDETNKHVRSHSRERMQTAQDAGFRIEMAA